MYCLFSFEVLFVLFLMYCVSSFCVRNGRMAKSGCKVTTFFSYTQARAHFPCFLGDYFMSFCLFFLWDTRDLFYFFLRQLLLVPVVFVYFPQLYAGSKLAAFPPHGPSCSAWSLVVTWSRDHALFPLPSRMFYFFLRQLRVASASRFFLLFPDIGCRLLSAWPPWST